MLVAYLENGEPFSLVKRWTKEELMVKKSLHTFHCPACKGILQLKLGDKRQWHFSHSKGSKECSVQSENETEYHMQGKIKLYHWLKEQYSYVELEPYLCEIRQRPDLLFVHKGKRFIIEYQCSAIAESIFIKRTKQYKNIGITPIWILGGKRYKRISKSSMRLSSFDFLSVLFSSHYFLLYFCPNHSQFLRASSITPFSPQITYSDQIFFGMNEVSLSSLLNINIDQKASRTKLQSFWLTKKKHWRLHAHVLVKNTHKSLRQFLYEKQGQISLLPPLTGLPVRSQLLIQNPPFIWQAWILYSFIVPLPIGEIIYISRVFKAFEDRLNMSVFQIRSLPLLKNHNFIHPITDYFDLLVKLKILTRKDKTTFIKINDVIVPKTIDEAITLDMSVIKQLNQTFV